MKKSIHRTFLHILIFLLVFCLELTVKSEGLPVINIHGYVTNNHTSAAVMGQEIMLAVPGNSTVFQIVQTDSTGYYSASLNAPAPQGIFLVYTYDCDGQVFKHIINYYSASTFQADFSICPAFIKDCTASFSFSPDPLNPNIIRFQDNSVSKHSIIERLWDFGDGGYSGLSNPSHLYNDSGRYIVSLHIISSDSCKSIISDTIQILQGAMSFCNANYFAVLDTSTGLPNVFKFFDNSSASSPINQRLWDFGDGATSNQLNPVHQFLNYSPQPDTFNVCLTIITITGCTSNYCFPFIISPNAPCNAFFSQTQVSGNLLNLNFHNQSQTLTPIAYARWDFGEGSRSNALNPQHSFPYPGYYNVKLEITTIDSCKSHFQKTVKVGNPNYYTLFGQSFSSNYPLLDTGVAYLYRTYPNNYIQAVDTIHFGSMGCYYFFQLIEGHYKINIRPLPSSVFYNSLAPTYYSDVLHWQAANHITLNSNQFNADVHLKPLTPQSGQGSISGSVYSAPASGTSLPVKDVMILLLNEAGQPVAVSYSNAAGFFSFASLATGYYTVYAESAGKFTLPVNVKIEQQNMNPTGVLLYIDNLSITGLVNDVRESDFNAKAFPIPAGDFTNLSITSNTPQRISLKIWSISGELVDHQTFNVGSGETIFAIPLEKYPKGCYIMHISGDKSPKGIYLKIIRAD